MVALSPHGNSSMYTFKFRNFSEGKSAYMYTCAPQPLKLLLTYPTGRSGPRSLRLYGFICSTVQRKRKIPSEGSMESMATTTTWHTVYRKRIVCRDCVWGGGRTKNIYEIILLRVIHLIWIIISESRAVRLLALSRQHWEFPLSQRVADSPPQNFQSVSIGVENARE